MVVPGEPESTQGTQESAPHPWSGFTILKETERRVFDLPPVKYAVSSNYINCLGQGQPPTRKGVLVGNPPSLNWAFYIALGCRLRLAITSNSFHLWTSGAMVSLAKYRWMTDFYGSRMPGPVQELCHVSSPRMFTISHHEEVWRWTHNRDCGFT